MILANLIIPIATTKLPRAKKTLPLRALNWIAERDRRYREHAKLLRLPSERLIDMGINC